MCKTVNATSKVNWVTTLDCVPKNKMLKQVQKNSRPDLRIRPNVQGDDGCTALHIARRSTPRIVATYVLALVGA